MLLAGLPALVCVNVRGSNAGMWLEASVRYALAEARSPRPGGAGVLAKLAEVLFIEVLRLHMNEQQGSHKGWLAGVGDRIVGAALKALHNRPAHPWTLDELAQRAGLSRTALAERFRDAMGDTPLNHLRTVRMQRAMQLLADGSQRLEAVASAVGYQDAFGFSKVFKRTVGLSPKEFRQRNAAERSSPWRFQAG